MLKAQTCPTVRLSPFRARRVVWLAALVSVFVAVPALANMEVPAGTSSNTGGGVFDLACSDLLVAGTLGVDNGQIINVRNVVIQPGGVINGNSGLISLSGNWNNGGSFAAGTGTVNFVDSPTCASSATLSGNTTFSTVNFTSTLGKTYTFAADSSQQISSLLTIRGTAQLPIVIVSSVPGQFAAINLTGNQQIGNVAVNWVAATGFWLAAYQVNRNPTGVAPSWFGEGLIVPSLSTVALALLTLTLMLTGLWMRRKSRYV